MNADEIVDYHRKRANDFAFNSWNREFHEQTATLIEQQQKEIADLKTKLTYAEDAAAKGELARMTAGGMEMEIEELRKDKQRLDWLEKTKVCDGGTVWANGGIQGIDATSLRQAITAAMQETKPKQTT